MLQKTTIDYLKKLKKNNQKEWFEANRTAYDEAKSDFIQLVEAVINHLKTIDTRYGELEAKKCIFRMNRDVRFSKDKSPYKINFGASFQIGGKKSPSAGFYLHIEPDQSFAGGGIWMPEADALKKIRQEIDYNGKEFEGIVSAKQFKTLFTSLNESEKLKNPPKGYLPNNEMIEYLKLKNFVTGHNMNNDALQAKDLKKKVAAAFTALNPLIEFLNKAVQ